MHGLGSKIRRYLSLCSRPLEQRGPCRSLPIHTGVEDFGFRVMTLQCQVGIYRAWVGGSRSRDVSMRQVSLWNSRSCYLRHPKRRYPFAYLPTLRPRPASKKIHEHNNAGGLWQLGRSTLVGTFGLRFQASSSQGPFTLLQPQVWRAHISRKNPN